MTDQEPKQADIDGPAGKAVRQIEQDIGLPATFLLQILSERDDWSFMVKMHALCETAVTQALVQVLANPGIETPIRKLHMRTKVALAKGLGIFPPSDERFLEALGTARNYLAHDIHQVSTFSLRQLATAPPAGFNIRHLFGSGLEELLKFAGTQYGDLGLHRFVVWLHALTMLKDLQRLRRGAIAAVEQRVADEVARRRQVDEEKLGQAILAELRRPGPEESQ